MRQSTFKVLFGIGNLGALGCIGLSGYVMFSPPRNPLKNSTFYTEAMSLLNSHPMAQKYLGEPMSSGEVVVEPLNPQNTEYRVRLHGPLGKGVMHINAVKDGEDKGSIVVKNIQVAFDKVPNQRISLKET